MSHKNIKISGVFLVAALFAAVAAFSTLAAGSEQCGLNQAGFDELQAAEESVSLGKAGGLTKELAIRKQLLETAVDCAIGEADNLEMNLNNSATIDSAMQGVKNRLADQIDNAKNYLALQKSKISDLGLQGSKDFAKNLNEWREGNYKPSAENANSFILWTNNQILIQSGQARMNQISKIIAVLKVVDNDEIQSIWNEAQANFGEALKENQLARGGFLEFAAPDEMQTHIKSSLDYLSSTYNNFLDIIGLINK